MAIESIAEDHAEFTQHGRRRIHLGAVGAMYGKCDVAEVRLVTSSLQ